MTIDELKQAIEAKQTELEAKTVEADKAVADENVELSKQLVDECKSIQAEIDDLKKQLDEAEATEQDEQVVEAREQEADQSVAEDTKDEASNEQINELTARVAELEQQLKDKNGEVRTMTNLVEETVVNTNESEVRSAFATYIQTAEKRAGLTTESGAIIVPTEVAKEVEDRTNDVTSLANLVQVKKVQFGQGEVAFFDGSTVPALTAEEELAQNPMIGIQAIKKAQYKVETYRGYFPVSRESIEDGIGAIELVKGILAESKVATENKLILDVLNAKQAVEATSADALKKILNVDLAVKHKKHIVMSQTVYNAIDTLKDGNGRYLLQDNISSQSGKQLFGLPVTVVEDATIGANTMYVGDLSAAVGLVDRSRYEAQWTSYMQFAECLMIALRLDAIELNPKAVVKVNFTVAPTV